MTTSASVLVLGAGELGIEVLKSLAEHPQRGDTSIAVLLRKSTINSDDEKKQAEVESIRALDVDLVPGDIVNDVPGLLSNTFSQFHTVISCTGMTFPPGTQLKVAQAVVDAGVKRYFPWQFGIDYDVVGKGSSQNLFDEQLDVRLFLRSQYTTNWTIVSTGMFLTFLFEPAFGVVNAERSVVTAIGSWDNALTVTTPHDIGKLTAELALACPQAQGVVFVAGDTVSMERLADIVDEVTGKKVERVLKSVPELQDELAADPDDVMRKYRVVFAEGRGVSWDKDKSFNGQKGIETTTVETWAKANLN